MLHIEPVISQDFTAECTPNIDPLYLEQLAIAANQATAGIGVMGNHYFMPVLVPTDTLNSKHLWRIKNSVQPKLTKLKIGSDKNSCLYSATILVPDPITLERGDSGLVVPTRHVDMSTKRSSDCRIICESFASLILYKTIGEFVEIAADNRVKKFSIDVQEFFMMMSIAISGAFLVFGNVNPYESAEHTQLFTSKLSNGGRSERARADFTQLTRSTALPTIRF